MRGREREGRRERELFHLLVYSLSVHKQPGSIWEAKISAVSSRQVTGTQALKSLAASQDTLPGSWIDNRVAVGCGRCNC